LFDNGGGRDNRRDRPVDGVLGDSVDAVDGVTGNGDIGDEVTGDGVVGVDSDVAVITWNRPESPLIVAC